MENVHHEDNDTIPTTTSSPVLAHQSEPPWELRRSHHVSRALSENVSDSEPESPLRENRMFPQVLVLSGLEYTSEVVQRTLLRVLDRRQVTLEGKDEHERGTWNLPQGFFIIYLHPSGDGRPQLHKSLVSPKLLFSLARSERHPQIDRFAFSFKVSLTDQSAAILWKEIDTRTILTTGVGPAS